MHHATRWHEGRHHYHCGHRRDARHGLFWGGALILAGVFFMLQYLSMLGPFRAWEFWPLLLVWAGSLHVGGVGSHSHRGWGVILMVIGGVVLTHTLGFFSIHWGLIWPVLVIVVGLYVLLHVFIRRRSRRSVNTGSAGFVQGRVVMGSAEEQNESQAFEGGHLSAVLGSYELDLTRAEIKGDSATVNADAVLGSVELRVPRHWMLAVKGKPVLGAVEDKTRQDPAPEEGRKTLFVNGSAVMGSVEIRN